jgi:hypothetical protein
MALELTFKKYGEIRQYSNAMRNNTGPAVGMTKAEREEEIKRAKEYEAELFAGLRALRNEIKAD